MKMRRQMEELVDGLLDGKILLGEAVSEFEKVYIEKCLGRNNNRISKSADVLGIHRNTLSKRLNSYRKAAGKTMARGR